MATFPPFDPRLLDAIEQQATDDWERDVWRATVGDTPVLRTNTGGARWNPPDVEVLYCSLDQRAALAELEYLLAQQPVAVRTERKISRLHVRLGRVVDLSTEGAVNAVGYDTSQLTSDDVRIAQRIGAAIEWLGVTALIVPSARFDASNLVIYMKNVGPSDTLDLIERFDSGPSSTLECR